MVVQVIKGSGLKAVNDVVVSSALIVCVVDWVVVVGKDTVVVSALVVLVDSVDETVVDIMLVVVVGSVSSPVVPSVVVLGVDSVLDVEVTKFAVVSSSLELVDDEVWAVVMGNDVAVDSAVVVFVGAVDEIVVGSFVLVVVVALSGCTWRR